MTNRCIDYGMDDVLLNTFMLPAVSPTKINFIKNTNMYDKTQTDANFNIYSNKIRESKFLSPEEGFLRGNMEVNSYIPYKNMTYIKPLINSERQHDLYKIQQMAFAAYDINLYLDTHPNDLEAISLYNEYDKQEQLLNKSYERKYGPVDLSFDDSTTTWKWIKEPWPWSK